MKLAAKTKYLLKPGTVLKSCDLYVVESVTEYGNAMYITVIASDKRRIYFQPVSFWYGAEIIEKGR